MKKVLSLVIGLVLGFSILPLQEAMATMEGEEDYGYTFDVNGPETYENTLVVDASFGVLFTPGSCDYLDQTSIYTFFKDGDSWGSPDMVTNIDCNEADTETDTMTFTFFSSQMDACDEAAVYSMETYLGEGQPLQSDVVTWSCGQSEDSDSGYQSFEYNGETHYLPPENAISSIVETEFPFFLRTNPLLSGSTAQYLYGYGYGYFATGYGYGYGFGYGYDYWTSYAEDWSLAEEFDKFGSGMGGSYGEFRFPVTAGAVGPTFFPVTLEAGDDSGGRVVFPEGLVLTANDVDWDGTLDVSGDNDAGNISGFGDNAMTVNIDLGEGCEDCTISLNVPVVIVVPWEFTAGDIVKVETADEEYEVNECVDDVQYDTGDDKDDPESYTLEENGHCYTYDDDNVYVATRHFSEFGAGDAGSSGSISGNYSGGSASMSSNSGSSNNLDYEPYEKIVLSDGTVVIIQMVYDFEDLTELSVNSWQYIVIQQMLDLGLFRGSMVNGKQIFDMKGTMTRGMAATVICRYMGCDEKANISSSFSDVPVGKYYTASVVYLEGKGIVSGKTSTIFDPNGTITRAEFFKMAVRAYMSLHQSVANEWENLLEGTTTHFDDVSSINWYVGYMNLASEKGLMKGYIEGSKTYAKGGKNISRVEAGAMVSNMLNL